MQYLTPATFEEAAALAAGAEGVTRFLAGGTDILVQMRAGGLRPDLLVDIKHIPGVHDITRTSDGGWSIGVAVPGARLGEHADLRADWPGVVEAVGLIGSTQVQGRATPVGNLMNGSPAADSVPALIAAGAEVSVLGAHGTARRMAVADIPAGPGRTALQKGDIITELHLPARSLHGGDAYQRFIPRSEMDIAVVGVAVNLRREGAVIGEARVALGAVAPTALLASHAAGALVGTSLDEAALTALGEAVAAACDPIDDKRGTASFRRHVAGVLAQRVAKTAYERAGETS